MIDAASVEAALESVLAAAAKPFLQRARFAMAKRGLLRDTDAAGRLTQLPGPHRGAFGPLATVGVLPKDVTYAQLIDVINQDAFKAYAQQLIAAKIIKSPLSELRISDELQDVFVSYIYNKELATDRAGARRVSLKASFRPAFDVLWQELLGSAENVASALADYPVRSASSFNWAQATLSLATIESLQQLIASRTASDDSWKDWLDDYRSAFVQVHNTIPLPDLGVRREVTYKDLFVEPQLSVEGYDEFVDFSQFYDLVDRTVILGDPGAGKSTTSTLIAVRWSENDGPAYLLPLRTLNIDAAGLDLVREIERNLQRRYQRSCPAKLIERTLLDGTALIVFDGLDEVESISLRRSAAQSIEAASARYPLCKIVVTSRRIGYAAVRLHGELFVEARIQPFDLEQIKRYVQSWFIQAMSLTGDLLTGTVKNFMWTSRTIPDLRENPLMLSYICVLYRGYNDIPRRRSQLFRKCVELLLFDWDMSRGIVVSGWEVDIYEIALIEIAYLILTRSEYNDGMTEQQLREVAAKNLLEEAVPGRREAERLAREVIERCRGRGWIFTDIGLNDQGEACFSFTHRSFLEYFAAQHLVRTISSPTELAAQILPYVLSAHGEILAQVCINLVGQQTAAGGSTLVLELLRSSKGLPWSQRFGVMQFLVDSADSVPLNRAALSALLANVVDSLGDHDSPELIKACMGRDFRHVNSVDPVLAEVLFDKNASADSDLLGLVRNHPWLWDFSLEHGVMGLTDLHVVLGSNPSQTFSRLFSGALAAVFERGSITSGLAMLEAAFIDEVGPRSRVDAIRDLAILRRIIGDPMTLDGAIVNAQAPSPYAISQLMMTCESAEKAVSKAAGYGGDVLASVVFLTLALCEIVDEWLPDPQMYPGPVLAELIGCRKGIAHVPVGVARLASGEASFVRAWCKSRVTIFRWDDKYRGFEVS